MSKFDQKIDIRNSESMKWNQFDSDVLPMWVADMDFMSAPAIIKKLQERAGKGLFGYAKARDIHFETIIKMLEKKHQFKVEKEWIVICPSVVSAIRTIGRLSAVEQGSEVIVPTPCYPPFLVCPQALGAKIHLSRMIKSDSRLEIDYKALEIKLSSQSDKEKSAAKYLILCNPHNPLGQVMTRDELLKLADWVKLRNQAGEKLIIISDEIHCEIMMDSAARHIPFASLDTDSAKNSITLMSPSKTYNTPGVSIGFAVIPDTELRNKFSKTISLIADPPAPFGLNCLEACYKDCDSWREEMLGYLRGNLKIVLEKLSPYSKVIEYTPPQATYLLWLDFTKSGIKNPHAELLKNAKLALSNGIDFQAEYHARLNFACPRETLNEGLSRFCRYLDTL